MKNVANSRFAIKNWDENPYSEGQGLPKMTRAAVTKTFTGDIEGEGHVEYLMMYGSDGSATFVGLERVVGQLAGKAGSFVLQRTGVFENGVAKEVLFRHSWLRHRRASGPAGRGHLGRWARDGASADAELRAGLAGRHSDTSRGMR